LLGRGPARIATGGKIRAGIKVLTKRAAEHPKAKAIYERGVAAGESFETIERAISAVVPELKTPLVPKNVPWFTVRGEDFPNPQIAKQILEAFGEDRGDGVKRLYRFPVVFPSDYWQAVMPHELVAWGANERKFWSEYSEDGHTRYCKCYAPVPMNDTGKRAIRIFGGRKTQLRTENAGVCDPEGCREYQQRQCNLSGRFIFFVPGIKSINAFELHTNSFYAMNAAIQRFETIAFLRGGRISGFLDGKRTPFYLSKTLVEVPHIDEDGRAVRVKHWIIGLEAPVDVSALLRANEEEDMALHGAPAAGPVIEGAAAPVESGDWPMPDDADAVDPIRENGAGTVPENSPPALPVATGPTQPASRGQAVQALSTGSPSLEDVLDAVQSLGLDPESFEKSAEKRWGAGWKVNANGRRRVLETIGRAQEDPQALRSIMDSEGGMP
jgi:hypothetical protein